MYPFRLQDQNLFPCILLQYIDEYIFIVFSIKYKYFLLLKKTTFNLKTVFQYLITRQHKFYHFDHVKELIHWSF